MDIVELMLTNVLFLMLGAVVGGLFAHDAAYKLGWDDGYEAAQKWITRREIIPARGERREP